MNSQISLASCPQHTYSEESFSNKLSDIAFPDFADSWINDYHAKPPNLIHALKTYILEDVVVCGAGRLYQNNFLLSCDEFLPKYVWKMCVADKNIVHSESNLPVRIIDEPTIVFMGHGTRVYGHFLIEMLPRLLLAKKSLNEFGIKNPKYLVDVNSAPWLMNILVYFDVKLSNIVLFNPKNECVKLSTGIVPVYPSVGGEFHPSTIKLIKEFNFFRKPKSYIELKTNSKIYLTRSGFFNPSSEHRILENNLLFDDIAMREFGLFVVAPESMDFQDQISLFENCDLLIGEAGSALHNSIFSTNCKLVGSIGIRNMIQSYIGALSNQKNTFLSVSEKSESPQKTYIAEADKFRFWLDRCIHYET